VHRPNELMTKFQHAYRQGFSTKTALVQMTEEWLTCLDEGKLLVRAAFLDFTAAFDVIDHSLLIAKPKCFFHTRH